MAADDIDDEPGGDCHQHVAVIDLAPFVAAPGPTQAMLAVIGNTVAALVLWQALALAWDMVRAVAGCVAGAGVLVRWLWACWSALWADLSRRMSSRSRSCDGPARAAPEANRDRTRRVAAIRFMAIPQCAAGVLRTSPCSKKMRE